MQSSLSAVVYASIVAPGDIGSTAIRHEVVRRGERLLIEVAERWGADFVKPHGSGLLARFGSAYEATSAATEMEHRLASDRRRHGNPSIGAASIGLSVGEVADVDGDLSGLTVVEAARLASVAAAGQILATEHLEHVLYPDDGLTFDAGEPVVLKGFDRPTTPVAVRWEQQPDLATRLPLPAACVPGNGPFVGRGDELREIDRCWSDARRGRLQLVQVLADPGTGKTALAAQAAARCRERGGAVMFGRSRAEVEAPYQAVAEALADFVVRDPRPRDVTDLYRDELGPILDPHASPVVDAETDSRTRLRRRFTAFADLLAQLAAETPLVIVLDDTQWLDPASVELLRFLLEHLVDEPILVIATMRSAEMDDNESVRSLLGDAARSVPGRRIDLPGLSETSIIEWLEQLGEDDPASKASSIHRRTGGNAFMVGELLAAGRHGGDADTPEGSGSTWRVQALVQARLDRLSERTVDVLRVGAVAGRSFDASIVAQSCDEGLDVGLDELETALDAGVLRDAGGGSEFHLMFEHDLLRETLLDEMSGLRQARIHLRLAEALEADPTRDRVLDLARHFGAAARLGVRDKAYRYHQQAGLQALGSDANELAATMFRAAETFVVDDDDWIGTKIGLGRALRRQGDPEAREHFDAAADRAAARGDARSMAAALLADYRGTFGIAFDVDEGRVARIRTALALAGDEPTADRALLLASLAVELVWAPDWQESLDLADRALLDADAVGDDTVTMQVLSLRQWVVYHPTERRRVETERLRTLVDNHDDLKRRFDAAGHRCFTSTRVADAEELESSIDLARWLADRIDQPLTRWMLLQREGCYAMLQARFDDAKRMIDEASELGAATRQPDAQLMFAVQSFWLAYEVAPLDAQRFELEATIPALDFMPSLSWPSVAFRCSEVGLGDAALVPYERAAATGFELPRDQIWLWNTCQLAGVAAVHDPGSAPLFAERLLPHRDEIANMVFSTVGPVARYLGLLAVATGDIESAVAYLAHAIEIAERAGARSWKARSHADLADALERLGRQADADRHRDDAANIAATIGLPLVDARLDGSLSTE